MAQFATLLKQQSDETKQLKEVFENFGKQAATVDQLDGNLEATNAQLHMMKQEPNNMIETAVGMS